MILIDKIKRYKRLFKNWVTVIFHVMLKKIPTLVIYRDGTPQNIYCLNHLFYVTQGFKFQYYNDHNSIIFIYRGKELRFCNVCDNGSIGDVFVHNELENLSVENKKVLDIGANIGDSSIFFALNGAKEVIAIEPFPASFETLVKNIDENGFQDLITPRNYAVSCQRGSISLSRSILNSVSTMAKDQFEGESIKTLTVKDIVEEFSLSSFVLKIDCEGCEYEVIESIEGLLWKEILEIFIEYHDTSRNIPSILRKNGFDVNVKAKGEKIGLIHGIKI